MTTIYTLEQLEQMSETDRVALPLPDKVATVKDHTGWFAAIVAVRDPLAAIRNILATNDDPGWLGRDQRTEIFFRDRRRMAGRVAQ